MIGVIQGMYWNHRRMWIQKSIMRYGWPHIQIKTGMVLKRIKWFIRIHIPHTAEGPK